MAEPDPDPVRAIRSLRAMRHFSPGPVPREPLERILDAARWTGSARNRQPWHLAVVRDATIAGRLSRLGAHAEVLATAPVVVLVLTDPDLGGADTEFDAGRLCQNLCLLAAAEGLGSCPATLHPERNARAAAALVGRGDPWAGRHAVAMGHPARAGRSIGRSAIPTGRRPPDQLVTWVGDDA